MSDRDSTLRRRGARQLDALQAAVLLTIVLTSAGCGDPGTGGSGIPTATTSTDSATGSGTTTANPGTSTSAGTDIATTPAQGSTASPNASLAPATGSSFGVIETPGVLAVAPAAIEVRVAGIRFDLSTSILLGTDGQSRRADRLLTGVPIRLNYAPGADLTAAAIGASGPAVRVDRAIVTDALPGQLISDAGASRVVFDNGSSVPLAAQAVIVGTSGAGNPAAGNGGSGNRVRAWVFTQGNLSEVSRVEFD